MLIFLKFKYGLHGVVERNAVVDCAFAYELVKLLVGEVGIAVNLYRIVVPFAVSGNNV